MLHLTTSVAQSKDSIYDLLSHALLVTLHALHSVLYIFYIIFIKNTCNVATIPTLKGYTVTWPSVQLYDAKWDPEEAHV